MGLSGGFVSGVHRAEDIEATLAAFEAVVTEMQAEGLT
jgi:glutamate-1-semialdehyde aminotransferase